MAVTANQTIKRDAGDRSSGGVLAAKTLYEGTLAFVDSTTGYITDDDAAGVNKFAGVVLEEADNSGGSSGDVTVELLTRGTFVLTGSGFTQADVGKPIYAIDNYTITTSSATVSAVGTARRFVSATQLAVSIDSAL